MAKPIVNGQFFERVQILVNNQITIDSDTVFRISVSGDEQASPVNAFSANHKISGVVRGNGQYVATLANYLRYNNLEFDWRGIDYDTQRIDIALLYPSANYGTNNVFTNSNQYLLLEQVFLSQQAPLDASGVGNPVTNEVSFIVTDWNVYLRGGGA